MSKILVSCTENNIPEREYVFDVFFKEILNWDYELIFNNRIKDYEISISDAKIKIQDSFFNNHTEPLSYLKSYNIPPKSKTLKHPMLTCKYPIICGDDFLEINENRVNLGIDIFGSVFFMLTRWEEYLINKKNNYDKVKETELLAVKNGFYNRPIVNEYAELIRILFSLVGVSMPAPTRQFQIKLTHDVDWVYLTDQRTLLKNLTKRFFKKGQKKKSLEILRNYYYYKIKGINPFDPFDEIMDSAEASKMLASFYFKAVQKNEPGFTYDITDMRVKSIISKIENRKHEVGFHPSENTFSNDHQFKLEVDRLKSVMNGLPEGGRNHGLYYNKHTFTQWEQNGFKYDSGLGFQYFNGFRCGICNEFTLFDIFNRKKHVLEELPFVLMDTVVLRNKKAPEDFFDEAKNIIRQVYKHKGSVAFNWHSNLVNAVEFKNYKAIYFRIIKYIGELTCDGLKKD